MPHRLEISRSLLGAATLLTLGCGGGPGGGSGGAAGAPAPRVPPPSRLENVFVLESSGVPPEDTAVTVRGGRTRVIILRRGPPDNSLFAEVAVSAAAPGSSTDSTVVTVQPRPGLYGIDLAANAPLPPGTQLTFSYGVHFVTPAGARQRYGSDLAFGEALLIARVEPEGRVVFLPTTRPGSDLVSAVIPGPGRYVVAAPR